jgi:uncharacterized protein DUF6941
VIKLNCFLIAEYATLSQDNKLVIAGTFDSLDAQRNPGAPPDALNRIPFPRATIVAVTEASIADGLSHQMRLRIINGNGQPIVADLQIPMSYALNQFGRPLRNNLLVNIQNLPLPGPDDYVFELYVDDNPVPIGELGFYVNERVDLL